MVLVFACVFCLFTAYVVGVLWIVFGFGFDGVAAGECCFLVLLILVGVDFLISVGFGVVLFYGGWYCFCFDCLCFMLLRVGFWHCCFAFGFCVSGLVWVRRLLRCVLICLGVEFCGLI